MSQWPQNLPVSGRPMRNGKPVLLDLGMISARPGS
jgi:hypothetical protein